VIAALFRPRVGAMKSPRNGGAVVLLTTAMTVLIAVPPCASGQLSLVGTAQPPPIEREDGATTVSRKGCKFGQRYSSFHRRCVFWTPFDLN
jgi:hypothetical protein